MIMAELKHYIFQQNNSGFQSLCYITSKITENLRTSRKVIISTKIFLSAIFEEYRSCVWAAEKKTRNSLISLFKN